MNEPKEEPKIVPVENPTPCGCPKCWNDITKAHMEGEYIVYKCISCGWQTPRITYYKIGVQKDDIDKSKDKND